MLLVYYTTEVHEKNRMYSHGQSSSKPKLFSSGVQAKSYTVGLHVSV